MKDLFNDQNRLWWFGFLLLDIGLLLWLTSLSDEVTITFLNILSTPDLLSVDLNGRLATQFAMGFGSAATIGWGITLMATSRQYTGETRSYLMVAVLVWYLLDGITSFLSQFYLNIVSNTLLLISALYVLYTTEPQE